MRPDQWQAFKNAAKRVPGQPPPLALIVDSPWIPGYTGISHLDYFGDPEQWLSANLRIMREFPDIIFFPSWWAEYGMAIEPSAFGSRFHFYADRPPGISPMLLRIEDAAGLAPVNPRTDGLMPLALRRYETMKARIFDAGYTIPAVAARGPLCIASFLRGLTGLMDDLSENRPELGTLLEAATRCTIDWIGAQAEVIGDSVEGFLILDDIVGLLSPAMYHRFAHPYLKQICDAFPKDWVKVYHNDANVRPLLADLPDTGFDVLNWSHKIGVEEAARRTRGQICLMGNVDPLGLAVRGSPAEVTEAARSVLGYANRAPLILSVGGGVGPGTPRANLLALSEALALAELRT